MTTMDKILNKITGGNIETLPVTMEQMLELLKKIYICPASTDEEYDSIIQTVKGSMFKDKKLLSKDGKYEIRCSTGRNVSIFNLKHHNLIWIHDIEADKYFEYYAWSFKKLKKEVMREIVNQKAHI